MTSGWRERASLGTLVVFLVMCPGQALTQSDSTSGISGTAVAGIGEASLPQEQALADSHAINKTRLAIVGGTLLTVAVAVQVYQANGWWRDNRRSFHFQEDLKYGLGIDKIGHFYGATMGTFIFSKSFQWANLSEASSLWWGAGASAFFQTYVEVQDGFSTWGFDRVDFAADIAGAFYPVVQYHVPFLRNFNIKGSYWPSKLINEPGGIGFKGQKHILFDDYEGQTAWLSINVHNLLPGNAKAVWPDWLLIAGGYGVRDVAGTNPYRVYFVGLDLDMTRIIPQDTAFLRTLSESLNFFRLPLPAIQVSPRTIVYGLYF